MADLNFPSMFDTRQAMDRQVTDDAYTAGNLPLGGGMMYAASLEGDLYGQAMQNLGGMLGGKPDPRVAKQQALDDIMQRFPDPRTPEQYMEVASALRSAGLHDYAAQTVTLANEIRSSMPKPSKPSAKIQEYEYAKKNNGYKGSLKDWIAKEAKDKPTNNIQEYEYAKKNNGYTGTLTQWLATNASKGDFTTAQKDIRDIINFDLKCDINDTKCYKSAEELYIERKRRTSSEEGTTAFAKAQGAAFSGDVTKSMDAANEARFYGNTIDQSMQLLDEGLYTGPLADTLYEIRKLGVTFGWADPGESASAEQFTVNSMKAIMAWVQKTKGAISEAEMKLFANASEGLGRTVGGNRLILLTARKLATYIDAKDAEMNRWLIANPNGTRSKWNQHFREWNKENGNTVPTKAEIDAALKTESISNLSTSTSGSSDVDDVKIIIRSSNR